MNATAARPMAPGDYLRLRREAAGLSVEDVALRIETIPHWHHLDRAEWIRTIESGIAPINPGFAAAMAWCYRFDPGVLDALIAPRADDRRPSICQLCGCSEFDACEDAAGAGCAWADASHTVCTACDALLLPIAAPLTRPGTIPPVATPGPVA